MRGYIWSGAAAALLLASTSTPAMALGVFAATQAYANDPLGENNISDVHVVHSFTGSVHASSEAIGFGALAVAEASTEYGINRAFAHATSPDLNLRFPPQASAFAKSAWSDELTINTAAQGGFISVEFQFHAFPIESSYAYPSAILTYYFQLLDPDNGPVTEYYLTVDGNGLTNGYFPQNNGGIQMVGDNAGDVLRLVTLNIPFTANRTFGIVSDLSCETRAPYDDAKSQTCDANGTTLWGGIRSATDANGNVLTDWTVRSASRTDYTKSLIPDAAGVPEPATWAMLILGFGAAGSLIRRRRALAA